MTKQNKLVLVESIWIGQTFMWCQIDLSDQLQHSAWIRKSEELGIALRLVFGLRLHENLPWPITSWPANVTDMGDEFNLMNLGLGPDLGFFLVEMLSTGHIKLPIDDLNDFWDGL